MFHEKMDLQLFNDEGPQGAAPANVGGSPASSGGTPSATPTPEYPGQQGTPAASPVGGQGNGGRPDGAVIRSVLSQAEQTWREKNAHLFELEKILQEQGYDAKTIAQQYREQQRQQQFQQQTGAADPRLMQYLQGLEGQVSKFQQYVQEQQRREAMEQIRTAENQNVELAKRFGIQYDDNVRNQVRMHAARTGLTVQAAFKELYFDQMLQVGSQQAQGQTLLNLQGRGQQGQPVSTAVPGGQKQGPVDWRTVSAEEFHAQKERLRNGR